MSLIRFLINFSEWLQEKLYPLEFEHLSKDDLAKILREFYPTVKTKEKEPYSKSGLINLRSGLNRYLTLPPNDHIINLMRDEEFQRANRMFKGKLRLQRKQGLDKTHSKVAVKKPDLQKMYQYVCGNLDNPELLQLKLHLDE